MKILVFNFLAKIWPFLAKNALFGPFLPNATINFPDFCYRNLFWGLLKNGEKKFRAKILVFDFLAKNALFGPFLPNAIINFPDFCYRNLFCGILKNGVKKLQTEILKFHFLGIFDQNFPFFDEKSCFWPFSPKRYYICS